mmetsp:Transcript_20260/g.64077  ORF Transcript_20260/g.64077 Transcript_20260/m.64077 type:complete len:357 (-) Transcript_20260:976-2046(-)
MDALRRCSLLLLCRGDVGVNPRDGRARALVDAPGCEDEGDALGLWRHTPKGACLGGRLGVRESMLLCHELHEVLQHELRSEDCRGAQGGFSIDVEAIVPLFLAGLPPSDLPRAASETRPALHGGVEGGKERTHQGFKSGGARSARPTLLRPILRWHFGDGLGQELDEHAGRARRVRLRHAAGQESVLGNAHGCNGCCRVAARLHVRQGEAHEVWQHRGLAAHTRAADDDLRLAQHGHHSRAAATASGAHLDVERTYTLRGHGAHQFLKSKLQHRLRAGAQHVHDTLKRRVPVGSVGAREKRRGLVRLHHALEARRGRWRSRRCDHKPDEEGVIHGESGQQAHDALAGFVVEGRLGR